MSLLIAACGTTGSGSVEETTDSDGVPTDSIPAASSTAAPRTERLALPVSDGLERARVDPDAPTDALAAGWNDAGFDLFRRLPAEDNVVLSPLSIGHALLLAAAAGDDYSMLILVPDAGRYDEVLERLDQDLLDEIDNTFTTGPYDSPLQPTSHSSTSSDTATGVAGAVAVWDQRLHAGAVVAGLAVAPATLD